MKLSSPLISILQQEILQRNLPSDFMDTVENSYLPVAEEIRRLREIEKDNLVVNFNGSQGSGKSTITAFLRLILIYQFNLNTVEISIDDFYHTHQKRQQLASEIHPLFQTRGVPGTHDVELACETLACLAQCCKAHVCAIPRFNKAIDDRDDKENWPVVNEAVDIVLFEGWCNHAPVLSNEELESPINELESNEDSDGVWRTYANEQLKIYHHRLFNQTNVLIYLQIPSFEKVFEWRGLQEQKLAQSSGNKNHAVMDEKQLLRFIQHYERITRSCLEALPSKADIVLKLDANHGIESVQFGKAEAAGD